MREKTGKTTPISVLRSSACPQADGKLKKCLKNGINQKIFSCFPNLTFISKINFQKDSVVFWIQSSKNGGNMKFAIFEGFLNSFSKGMGHFWISIKVVKFMFSKKATKIDKIFIIDLTLCSKCQIYGEDFMHELY